MVLYLVQPRFFFPLFQFLWLQGQTLVLDWRKGQQYFCRIPPSAIGNLAIFVHGQSGLTDWITGRNRFRGFRTAWIEGG